MGDIQYIHVASSAGGPMQSRHEVVVVPRSGVLGDRYATRSGYWRDDRVSRDLTLIEAEAIASLAERGIELAPGETRRNLTTRGVNLSELVGQVFWIGDVIARGTSLCNPCQHLVQLTGKPILRPLVGRGGVRADVLTRGRIRIGDPIDVATVQAGVGVLVARGDEVLIGRRLSAHGYGTWSVPGGRPQAGESAVSCASRELREETGLEAEDHQIVGESLDAFPESHTVFHTTFVRVRAGGTQPRALEPEKTARWEWRSWKCLPDPLFRPVESLAGSGYVL
jgi:ADP-ribose pyrophosphatase YjhB (NUDIX family)